MKKGLLVLSKSSDDLTLSDFDYELPQDRIASMPAVPRSSAKMLDMQGDDFTDRTVADLPSCLAAGDVLVVNNTRVLPARLHGFRGVAKIEVTLHQRTDEKSWRCFAKPAKKLRLGDRIIFADNLTAQVDFIGDDGERGLTFSQKGAALDSAIEACGTMPLPPYILRKEGIKDTDKDDYQTMFAAHNGAVAAPTAGLHFTPELLASIRSKGVIIAEITLHVGAGTFLPVKVEDLSQHKMHSEWGEITSDTAAIINKAIKGGNRIIAVGTTSLRILESCWRDHGCVQAYRGETDLFILPGFRFGVVDMLLTNFHLPRSTLLMLVSAFAGRDKIKRGYAHAIASSYRFFSYGDACLMERNND